MEIHCNKCNEVRDAKMYVVDENTIEEDGRKIKNVTYKCHGCEMEIFTTELV